MRINLWGSLLVIDGDRRLTARDFPGIKPQQFLEILTVSRGHSVSKARLADLLWTEQLPQNHPATLETYASVLRQTLEPGVRARESVVLTERGGYRLDLDRVTVDLDEFDAGLRAAAAVEPREALLLVEAALTVARGQVLEDEPYADWAEQARGTYRLRHVQALIDAGRLRLAVGSPGEALRHAEDAVRLNPLAEAAYQVQMTAAYRLGRQEEALAAFDRCRKMLADELGVDPLEETVALHLSILRHEGIAVAPPTPPTAPAAVSSTGPPAGTPARSAPAPAVRPRAVGEDGAGALLGRESELERVGSAVASAAGGRYGLLLVVGDSGMGKTALLQEVVRCAGLPAGWNRCSDLESELSYVALSLGLRQLLPAVGEAGAPILGDLLRDVEGTRSADTFARLRAMERLAAVLSEHGPSVLVLDDAQWADEASLVTLGYLRRRCPEAPLAVVLATTREGMEREALRDLSVDLRVDLDVLPAAALAPLGDPQVHELTGGLPQLVAAWREARRGGLTEPFPPGAREWVVGRYSRLGPEVLRLASTVSVLDAPVELDLLSAVVGAVGREAVDRLVDDLDLLVGHRALLATAEGLSFRHEPERRILSSTVSPARRGLLLERVATFRAGPPRRRMSDHGPGTTWGDGGRDRRSPDRTG